MVEKSQKVNSKEILRQDTTKKIESKLNLTVQNNCWIWHNNRKVALYGQASGSDRGRYHDDYFFTEAFGTEKNT